MKTARQNIVNQSENGYGWDNYTDYELSIAMHSIKCFDTQDTKEKLRLTCGVTAAHCHWSRARSESDDWPVHTRFKGKLNSWHRESKFALVRNLKLLILKSSASILPIEGDESGWSLHAWKSFISTESVWPWEFTCKQQFWSSGLFGRFHHACVWWWMQLFRMALSTVVHPLDLRTPRTFTD